MATDTAFETISYSCGQDVATITLRRPERFNAINAAMHRELAVALRQATRDGARALVLTGDGKAFCSGIDLKEVGMTPGRIDDLVRATFNRLALSLRELPMPVIAAVNGVAAGAGASLALCCDLRVCSDRASFMQAFVRIGLVPDTGSTWLLPHLVGISRALELAWTGDPVDAEAAVAMGMASEVVPHDELAAVATERARRLASMPTRAIAMTKHAMYRALTSTFADALEHEAQLQQQAVLTDDHREGIVAFFEKREPSFTGS